MKLQTVELLDRSENAIAIASVADEGAYYGGTIDLHMTPASIRALFEEFDEYVNRQMFSFLDAIEDRIAALGIKALFNDGRLVAVRDLQVHPSTGDVAFKLAEVAAVATRTGQPKALGTDDDRLPGR
jgi:hypothetical protein